MKTGIRQLPLTARQSSMTLEQILTDPSISSWLKDAVKMAYEQDPIDALRDAHRLIKMLGERYTQVVNQTSAKQKI